MPKSIGKESLLLLRSGSLEHQRCLAYSTTAVLFFLTITTVKDDFYIKIGFKISYRPILRVP
ncbi:hypothetical protein NEOLI_005034 [Neolecta irregularis DAH-3]|uniref:Uncharacterized protein n=1 Tax=Neolecta irregularis (strain DAH-3) TaxID=1198029 RepID=A0A1U7LJ31_NEOID|nr:hypothetical protein NEOLI_005034 [Neolecta irregularis DAH-3]|eukprot:OLL22603.1 hypothetical protein NEOLI_005034 [Neolecta irregularis DAH-3]